MALLSINDSTLTAIGNAIRNKTGTSALIPLSQFDDMINSISSSPFPSNVVIKEVNIPSDTTATQVIPHGCPLTPSTCCFFWVGMLNAYQVVMVTNISNHYNMVTNASGGITYKNTTYATIDSTNVTITTNTTYKFKQGKYYLVSIINPLALGLEGND